MNKNLLSITTFLILGIVMCIGFTIQAQTVPPWAIPSVGCADGYCPYTVRLDELQNLYIYEPGTDTLYVSPADGSSVVQHDLTGMPPWGDFMAFSDGFVVFIFNGTDPAPPFYKLRKYDLQSRQVSNLDLPIDVTSCRSNFANGHLQQIIRLDNKLLVCGRSGDDIALSVIDPLSTVPIIENVIPIGPYHGPPNLPWMDLRVGLDGKLYMLPLSAQNNLILASFNAPDSLSTLTHVFILQYTYETGQWAFTQFPRIFPARVQNYTTYLGDYFLGVDEQGNYYFEYPWSDSANNQFQDIVKYNPQGVFVGSLTEQDITGEFGFRALLGEDTFLYSPIRNSISSLATFNIPMSLPIANAGPDQTLADNDNNGTELVTLDGSGSSDSDGTIVSYEWSEDGVVIATGVTPQVDLAVGEHSILLTVTDDDGATGGDVVVITVEAPSITCDFTIATGDSADICNLTHQGRASLQLEMVPAEYNWHMIPTKQNGNLQIGQDF